MLRNYLKTAIRSLIKQRIYSVINILGLTVSMTACLLIVIYVKHEISYDTFFPDADRIYDVALERKYPNHSTFYAVVPHSYATAIRNDFPEVERTLQMIGFLQGTVHYKMEKDEVKSFDENFFMLADSSFFYFFDIPMLKGDRRTALALPNQVIISQATALKYFGDEEPVGKILTVPGGDFKVTGVFENIPDNSHLRLDFVGSFSGNEFRKAENYIGFDSRIYVKLKPGSDAKALEAKFPKMVDTYASGQIERELGQSWEDYKKAGNGYRYFLQPLTSIHLDPTNLEFTITPSGNLRYIYILSFVGVLILVIACINFMNLATARSTERAREIGVRKVLGSAKSQLITQFLFEAVLLSLLGTVIAVMATLALLPAFDTLIQKQLHLFFTVDIIFGLLGFGLFVGLLAGIYPAFILSAFQPVEVMKGSFSGNSKGVWLRNGLVVFQFMMSIILIIGTVIIGEQMRFMQDKDLGFDKESVLMVDRAFALREKTESFLAELSRMPEVKSASSTSARVGNRDDVFGQMFQPQGSNEVLTVKSMIVDDDFAQNIGFKLKDGRFFSRETSDSLHVILNETAVKTIGLSNPVGSKLSNTDLFAGNPERQQLRTFTIIGVAQNFHFQSLRDEITPLVIFSTEVFGPRPNSAFIAVRVKPGGLKEAIVNIENKWKEFVPDQPFRYELLEDSLNRDYAEEQRSASMFAGFSSLAIIIASVGLFGLSVYTASRRTKEIGIRKVLGGSVGNIVMLLSKDFTKLVIIAFVLAAPLAWWMMDKWLSSFAYRIPLGVGAFITAGLLALSIAWLTISYQSIRAAVMNPVKSLKQE